MTGKEFKDLWMCRETVHDGEAEYGCEFFVRASNYEEAEKKAWQHVHDNYNSRGGGESYTKYLKDDGRYLEFDYDYRLFEAEVVKPVNNLEDILMSLGCVE